MDERNYETKIKKKKEELERTEKRLKNMENVRPQFMDEVEKLEKELQRHYEIYIDKYRNLDYLEKELEKYHRLEEEKKQEHDRRLKKMRDRLLREEVELLRGTRYVACVWLCLGLSGKLGGVWDCEMLHNSIIFIN